ncbi:MAG: hypothetical protein ACI4L9_01475 [Candidatus Coproplasma sp.]
MKKFVSLINYSMNPRSRSTSLYMLKTAVIMILIFSWFAIFKGFTPIFEWLGLCLGLCTVSISSAFCIKPSLCSIVPTSYKKRVLYYYLDIVIYTLIGLIIFLLIFLVIGGIAGLAVFLSTGENIFVIEETETMINLSANAYLFSFFRCIFVFAVLSAISRIENVKRFLAAGAAFVAVYIGGNVLLSNLVITGDSSSVVFSAKVYELFETLPSPTLAVVLCAVIAVAAAVGSVAFIVYKEKPKAF